MSNYYPKSGREGSLANRIESQSEQSNNTFRNNNNIKINKFGSNYLISQLRHRQKHHGPLEKAALTVAEINDLLSQNHDQFEIE